MMLNGPKNWVATDLSHPLSHPPHRYAAVAAFHGSADSVESELLETYRYSAGTRLLPSP